MTQQDLAVYEAQAHELTVEQVLAQKAKLHDLIKRGMVEGVDYGTIPGTNGKPTLLKPGAEKINVLLRLDPEYDVVSKEEAETHISFVIRSTLYHIGTGQRVGSGLGSCSSRESKYAWRQGQRACPNCGASAIIKGQEKYGGGWVCWKKKDGCGATFDAFDPLITSQSVERVPNPDIWDQYNTILKMAMKRAHIAATLNATAASEIFTQDLEDRLPHDDEPADYDPPSTRAPAPAAAPPRRPPPAPPTRTAPSAPTDLQSAQAELFLEMGRMGITDAMLFRHHKVADKDAFNARLKDLAAEGQRTLADQVREVTKRLSDIVGAHPPTEAAPPEPPAWDPDVDDAVQDALPIGGTDD